MSSLPRQQIEHTGPSFDQLKMERRRAPRRLIEELATAVFHAGKRGAERFGLTRVVVIDTSHTGIGLKTDCYFEPGTRMTLTQNNVPMPHRSGTVVRCVRETEGFSVGVVYDRVKAA